MNDKPDETPDDAQNPFKGTPFEQIFGAAGGAGGPARCPTSTSSSASCSS